MSRFQRIDPTKPYSTSEPGVFEAVVAATLTFNESDSGETCFANGVQALDFEESLDAALQVARELDQFVEPDQPGSDPWTPGANLLDVLQEHYGNARWHGVTSSGIEIGETQILAALVLYQCEQVAAAIDSGQAREVAIRGWDVHELLDEIESIRFLREQGSALSRSAKSAAAARHAENHAMRDQVLDHFRQHRDTFKSKDDAALAMAGKLVPVRFRTVRQWLNNA